MKIRSAFPRREFLAACLASTALSRMRAEANPSRPTLHAVSNFHPACMGWVAPYHIERNYCLYSYLDHQDRALLDPEYRYVLSEIPHLITMLEYEPARVPELQGLVKKGQCEFVNGFVLEPTVSLSGGEALVMQGVEGLRWYKQVLNARPRHCWMIDVCGFHEQMAQIVSGLGLETFVYCRDNPTNDTVHWIESPDGTRALAVSTGDYAGALTALMRAEKALTREQVLASISETLADAQKRTPPGMPLLGLAGSHDYSLPFPYKGYPREAIRIWESSDPPANLRMSILGDWLDQVAPLIASGKYPLVTVKSGSRYILEAFWVNAPEMKQRFRRSEHSLQAAEALAAAASLRAGIAYPSQDLSNAWFLMALNMDRNTLWGASFGSVFKHPKSWDATDRLNTVDRTSGQVVEQAIPALLGKRGPALGVFNPSNWPREGVVELTLSAGESIAGLPCQALEDGKTTLVRAQLPAMSISSFALSGKPAAVSRETPLPEKFENAFYVARVDATTGALASLKLKPSGREMLGGPANVVIAAGLEPGGKQKETQHEIPPRAKRVTLLTSSNSRQTMRVTTGPLATTVTTTCPFRGGDLQRVIRFYADSPRIDFVTTTNDVPEVTMVTAEFPLAEDVLEVRRGIPYGFSLGAWAKPNVALHGIVKGINPAIRWSHCTLANGGGVALLDRGVPGREMDGKTIIVHLLNANDTYLYGPAEWISGKGKHSFEYALIAHESPWAEARIPQLAWDYNAAPVVIRGVQKAPAVSFLETSNNVIVEAFRRAGDEIEIRMVEAQGVAGRASISVQLPHKEAALTDILGGKRTPLTASAGSYRFDIRPQQIVTLRLKTATTVPSIQCLTTFDSVVPEAKRAYTRGFKHPEWKGHPNKAGSVDGSVGPGVPEWAPYDK